MLDREADVDKTALQKVRTALLRKKDTVSRLDLGAGSRGKGGGKVLERKVSELAATSLTPPGDLEALCRWLRVLDSRGSFLELGTSLGVTSSAVAQLGWAVETWEGCPETLGLAREVWQSLGVQGGIEARQGDFRDLLKEVPSEARWDVVFLDGLHEEHATVQMAQALAPHVEVCLVVDDIAWSAGMHRAWRVLQSAPEWRVSFSWRGRGFLMKAPHMARQRFRLG
ncbi:MAG: class I SAM-dependent methyltransferase [Flavobacteriales bacterium]|nr:class I SAM-dependent methyltransferase [Flavobacteriales bacterium]